MKPVNSQIIICPKKAEDKTSSGIILNHKDIDQNVLGFGTVHAVCQNSEFEVGQEILYNRFVPNEFKLEDKSYFSMDESNVIAIL